MTPTNDAEKALGEMLILDGMTFSTREESVVIHAAFFAANKETIRTALANSAKVDVCADCGSPMMDVCSGLEKISREGCNPETKTKVDGLLEALKKSYDILRAHNLECQYIYEAIQRFNGEV